MDEIQNTAPIAEPKNLDELLKLIELDPDLVITEDDAEPTEAVETPVLN